MVEEIVDCRVSGEVSSQRNLKSRTRYCKDQMASLRFYNVTRTDVSCLRSFPRLPKA